MPKHVRENTFESILGILANKPHDRHGIYSVLGKATGFNLKMMERMAEDLRKGFACICDLSVAADPFLLRLATLSHRKIYAIMNPYDAYGVFRANSRTALSKEDKTKKARFDSKLEDTLQRVPWMTEAFSDGTLVAIEQVQ